MCRHTNSDTPQLKTGHKSGVAAIEKAKNNKIKIINYVLKPNIPYGLRFKVYATRCYFATMGQ